MTESELDELVRRNYHDVNESYLMEQKQIAERMVQMNVNVKRLTDTAKLPTRGSAAAAGYDLYADERVVLLPHTTALVSTGLSMELPEGYFGGIFARSGLASREGLRPANCVGVIDSDYRGDVKVALHNDSDVRRAVTTGERIAQLLIIPYLPVEFTDTNKLSDTTRGNGDFGSTGKE